MKAWEREPVAADYARYRPRYPDALFEFIAERSAARDAAWDCATGSGQAAVGLASRFRRVVATDRSANQIAEAIPRANVAYRVATAEQSGLADASVDAVTVAQALHWLDLDAFFAEVRRVLRPGGPLAAWCYPIGEISPEIDVLLAGFYHDVVRPYWDPRIQLVDDRYETIEFPAADVTSRTFWSHGSWTLGDLIGFIRTWSGREQFIAARGYDPLDELTPDLEAAWGDPGEARAVAWPIWLKMCEMK